MDMLTGFLIGFGIYCSFKLGQMTVRNALANQGINNLMAKATIPVAVAEKIEGHYYLWEKDTTNFLCQAPSLDELPAKLIENKKISLALVLCPEESADQIYWCINGKLKIVES